jgi:hypothetical protein
MARTGQRGISAAAPFTGPTVWATCNGLPHTATSGTDTTPVVTEEYVAEVFVPMNCIVTGFSVLNGSAVAGNMQIALYDSEGGLVATTASTAVSGTAAYQAVPFSSTIALRGPAEYFIGLQNNNTSNRFRSHTVGVHGASKKTGQTYGTFTALTPPTTFTTALAPIGALY